MRTTLLTILTIGALVVPMAVAEEKESKVADRLDASADVLTDMMHASDKGIPQDLMNRAQCVVVIPNMKKAGFIWGAKYAPSIWKRRRLCRGILRRRSGARTKSFSRIAW